LGLIVGRKLGFDDDCMHLRISCKSRGFVLGLLVGRTLGFDDDYMPLNSSV
jgi:hypothetical protein